MKSILISIVFVFLCFHEGISQVAKGVAAKGLAGGADAIHTKVTFVGPPAVPISVWSIVAAFVIIIALIGIRNYRIKMAK
jgi:hypothetical protein